MQLFYVLSAHKGPMPDGNGSYAKVWVHPLDWEDRPAPHLTRGPVPFEMKANQAAVDFLASRPLPAVFDLDVQIRVASGNVSTAFCVSAQDVKKEETKKPLFDAPK